MENTKQVQELVLQFAKANRVSQAKTMEFASTISQLIQKTPALKGDKWDKFSVLQNETAMEISKKLNMHYDVVRENLQKFEAMGLIVKSGHDQNFQGRGRKPAQWSAVPQLIQE